MTVRVSAAIVVATALGGCSLTSAESIPIRGDAPVSILVLPPVGHGPAGLMPELRRTLESRGYDVVPAAAGSAELEARDLMETGSHASEAYAAAARALDADAFMTVRVERWQTRFGTRLVTLDYDVGYRIWSADTGDPQWEVRSSDTRRWERPSVHFDSSLESYLRPNEEMSAALPFRNEAEVVSAVHRRALRALPRAPKADH